MTNPKERKLKTLNYDDLFTPEGIAAVVRDCYNITGNKFSVAFHGSKGYLSHIEISAEGLQPGRANIIWLHRIEEQKVNGNQIMVSIYYSAAQGVRVAVENV